MAELDPDVIEVAKAQFGRVHRGAFDDPRLKVTVGDGLAYLRATGVRYDLVAMDLTDPVGPSAELYSPATFALARRAMADGGALVAAPRLALLASRARARRRSRTCARSSACVAPYFVHIPLYGSIWGFACASDSLDPRARRAGRGRPAPRRARRGRPAVLQRRDAPRRVRAAELRAAPRRLGAAEREGRMLRKVRKSSSRVTLVLIGLAGAGRLRRRRATSTPRARTASPTGATSRRTARPPPSRRHAGPRLLLRPVTAHASTRAGRGSALERAARGSASSVALVVGSSRSSAARRARPRAAASAPRAGPRPAEGRR